MNEEILIQKEIANHFDDIIEHRKKYIEILYSTELKEEREEILNQINVVTFRLIYYTLDLKIVKNSSDMDEWETEDFIYSSNIKKFLAERLIYLSSLKTPDFTPEESFNSIADMEMGYGSINEEESRILHTAKQEYIKLEDKLKSIFKTQTQFNPYFIKLDGKYILFDSKVDEETNKIKSQSNNSKPLLFKGEKNIIPTIFYILHKENIIVSSKADLIKFLMDNFKDEKGESLKKSTLDDTFNISKHHSKSKKVTLTIEK